MILFVFQSQGDAPKIYTQPIKAYNRARKFIDDKTQESLSHSQTGITPDEIFGTFDLEGFQDLSSVELSDLIEKKGSKYQKLYSVKLSNRISGSETEIGSVWATTCKFSGETIEEAD